MACCPILSVVLNVDIYNSEINRNCQTPTSSRRALKPERLSANTQRAPGRSMHNHRSEAYFTDNLPLREKRPSGGSAEAIVYYGNYPPPVAIP